MQMKSKRTIAASALALVVVGGGAVAVITMAAPGPSVIAPASLPSPAGPPVTATVPGGAAERGNPARRDRPDSRAAAAVHRGDRRGLRAGDGAGEPDADPRGRPGGAGPAAGRHAARRRRRARRAPGAAGHGGGAASLTALPHSPRLLAELGGATSATATAQRDGHAGSGDGTASPTPPTLPRARDSPTGTGAAPHGHRQPARARHALGAPRAAWPRRRPAPRPRRRRRRATPTATTPAPTVTPTPPVTPAANAGRTLPGLDVAGYQHPVTKAYPKGQPIGWSSVAAAGYKFAAIKATEGDYYVNPWAAHRHERGEGGRALGHAVPLRDTQRQRRRGAGAVRRSSTPGTSPARRMLPLMLDIEYDPYTSSDHTNDLLRPDAGEDDGVGRRVRDHGEVADRAVSRHLHDGELVEHLHRRVHRVRRRPDVGGGLRVHQPADARRLARLDDLAVHERRHGSRGGHRPAPPTSTSSTPAWSA